MSTHRSALALAAWASLVAAAHAVPLSTAITYQGRLESGGIPVDGAADLRFELFDAPLLGNLVAGPLDRLTHPVSAGLLTVANLDFGMSPFDGAALYLQVSARVPPGGGAWEALTPRQRIAPAPYAIHSMHPWITDGNDIYFDGTFVGIGTSDPNYRLHVQSTTPRAIFGICTNLTGNTTGVYGQSNSTGGEGVTGWATAATGTTSGVYGQSDSEAGRGVFGLGTSGRGTNYGVYGEARGEFGSGLFGLATSANSSATAAGVRGQTQAIFGAGVHGVANHPTGLTYGVRGGVASPNGWAAYFEGRSYFSGSMGIGPISLLDGPLARVHVVRSSLGLVGGALGSEDLIVEDTDAGVGIFSAAAGAGGSHVSLAQVDGTFGGLIDKWTIIRETTSGGNGLRFTFGSDTGPFNNPTRVYFNDDGRVGIGTLAPANTLTVSGDANVTGSLGVGTAAPGVRLHVVGGADATLNGGGYVQCGSSSGANVVMDTNEIMARNNGAAASLTLNNDGGDVIIAPQGEARVRVLQITGADLAEKFPASESAEPGLLMEIDPTQPGKLRIARGAYNRRVAGVVSGAGDLPAGAILGNLPASENGPAIALSGRVWAWCDAATGAIQPGDMLTTAETPGHAMKVQSTDRAHGAVIGKAMTGLPAREKGLVLVLVNLQ